jgi:hypothetical protein
LQKCGSESYEFSVRISHLKEGRGAIEGFIGMLRERVGHSTDLFVTTQINHFGKRLVFVPRIFPFVPRPHQRVLQNGQLILVVADVVEQLPDVACPVPPQGHTGYAGLSGRRRPA